MSLFKHRPSSVLVAQAEEISDELASLTAPLEAAAWQIDAALSAIRKDAAGYRKANAANRTGGDSYEPGELEAAVRRGRQLLLVLAPIRGLEKAWAQEEATNAAVRLINRGPIALVIGGAA